MTMLCQLQMIEAYRPHALVALPIGSPFHITLHIHEQKLHLYNEGTRGTGDVILALVCPGLDVSI